MGGSVVLTVGDDSLKAEAEALANKSDAQHASLQQVRNGGLTAEALTLVGHSSSGWFSKKPTKMGNKTPKELALALALKYGENKQELKHLYVLSCEAGLWFNGKPPLAHELAVELHRLGFANVEVHAFSQPIDHQAGGGQVVELNEEGAVRSVTYRDERAVELQKAYEKGYDALRSVATSDELSAIKANHHRPVHDELSPWLSAENYQQYLSEVTNTYSAIREPRQFSSIQHKILARLWHENATLPTGSKGKEARKAIVARLEAQVLALDAASDTFYHDLDRAISEAVSNMDKTPVKQRGEEKQRLLNFLTTLKTMAKAPDVVVSKGRNVPRDGADTRQGAKPQLSNQQQYRDICAKYRGTQKPNIPDEPGADKINEAIQKLIKRYGKHEKATKVKAAFDKAVSSYDQGSESTFVEHIEQELKDRAEGKLGGALMQQRSTFFKPAKTRGFKEIEKVIEEVKQEPDERTGLIQPNI